MSDTASNDDKKPEAPEWLIVNIAEASQNVRKIYFLYIGFLAYCGLTVAGTKDRQLILNEPVSLPIIDVDVSLNGFFILAPILAILIFGYMQLYLHRIKGLKTDLRTHYAPVEKRRLYPWLLNIAEDPEPGSIGKLQGFIVNFSLWWPLPIILILNAIWYLKKHDPVMSYILGALPVVGTAVVLYFWYNYEHIKTDSGPRIERLLNYFGFKRRPSTNRLTVIYNICLVFLIPITATVVFCFYRQIWSIFGALMEVLDKWLDLSLGSSLFLAWGTVYGLFPAILLFVIVYNLFIVVRKNRSKLVVADVVYIYGLLFVFVLIPWTAKGGFGVDLSYQTLTNEPATDYAGVYWLDLNGVHLEYADLTSTVLKRADLRNAHLQGANLSSANLSGADLDSADLSNANLTRANLKGADIRTANLQYAQLISTDLAGHDLREASLQGIKLLSANLTGADLSLANLRGADLKDAKLNGADMDRAKLYEVKNLPAGEIRKATNWPKAYFSKEAIKALGLQDDHNERYHGRINLREVDLQGAVITTSFQGFNLKNANLKNAILKAVDLSHADLSGADLTGADLRGAKLTNSNLQDANLSGVKGLDKKEIKKARNWLFARFQKDFQDDFGLSADLYRRYQNKDLSGMDLSHTNLQVADLGGFNLQGANLEGAELEWAILKGAIFDKANLSDAGLWEADLEGADLRKAQGLSVKQLSRVKTLYNAKLDHTISETIRKEHPELLQKPKQNRKYPYLW